MNFSDLDPLTAVSSILFLAVMIVFGLGFFINWYRNRKAIAPYKRLGFRVMLIVVGFELLTLVLSASGYFLSALPIILGLAILMLRMWAFVNNGIFYSNKLGLRSFPLVAPRLGLPVPIEAATPIEPADSIETELSPLAAPSIDIAADSASAADSVSAAAMTLPAVAVMPSLVTPLAPTNRQRYWLTTIGVALGAVVYSVILFAATGPAVGIALRDLVGGASGRITPLLMIMLVEVALVEELTFRLGIQNYLAARFSRRRHGYWIAIVLTSIIWTLGHAGSLDPTWIKFAQIFPVGLALGWLYRRNGIESTIIAHSLFNLIGPFFISIR